MFLLTVNLALFLVGFSVNLVYQYDIFLGGAFMDMTLTGRSKSNEVCCVQWICLTLCGLQKLSVGWGFCC